MRALRTFLALSRAAGLPTVWSNCLAGWWLSGGGRWRLLPCLFGGATFIYLGGAFLNDVLDTNYDREYRRARPIPSGVVSAAAVLRWGLVFLLLSEGCWLFLGKTSTGLGLSLALCVVLYNATHRLVTFSPLLLGLCRLLLYLVAATAGGRELTGWPMWCGLALTLYVAGVRCLPRPQNILGQLDYWPLALLAAPIFLALLMDVGEFRWRGLELSAVLGLWVVYALRRAFWPVGHDFVDAVSALMAGIVLVDWLAVVDVPRFISLAFLGCFGTVLLLRRVAPL